MAIIKIRNAAIDLDAAEIPNLPASKITSGTLDNARISLDSAEIPNLDTAKITSGTLSDARLPANALNSNVSVQNQSAFKNIIINGDMSIHQRVSAATANNKFGVDRFLYNDSNNFGQRGFTFEPNTDVPTGQGFAKCMKITMTTPETAIAAGEYARVMHRIEGQNLQSLRYGTSSAKTVTLSFWLKTNVTGNFGVSLFQDDDSRIIGTTYTQASSGTWEKITVTFTGDTTGIIDNDNGSGLRVMFMLSAGSDFTSSNNTSWGTYANNKLGYGHTANLLGTSSGYWQVTGVQLEIGSSATDFEFLPHDVNLLRCQRYYEKSYSLATAPGTTTDTGRNAFFFNTSHDSYAGGFVKHVVQKRATPTITTYAPGNGTSGYASFYVFGTSTTNASAGVGQENEVGFTVYRTGTDCNAMAFHYTIDSEL